MPDDGATVDAIKMGEGEGPMPPEFDLLAHGLSHARESLEGLEDPEEDIMPVLLFTGPYGMGVMPLLDMEDDAAKDALAEMMTTTLACSRADQALMITCSWMVHATKPKGDKSLLDVMPSEHPDRVEVITAMYMTAGEKTESITSAVIIRHPDKPPELGPWDTTIAGKGDDDSFKIGGRFGDAIHMGFNFVEGMPPPLIEILDEGWAAGEQEQLIERFHKVFTGFLAAMDKFAGDTDAAAKAMREGRADAPGDE
jgi:hypothetical protein